MIDWLFSTDFAARADGSCTGWTLTLAIVHGIGETLVWGAYVMIPLLLLRARVVVLNPLSYFFALFIFVCGFDHLLGGLTDFVPVYNVSVVWTYVLATVSWATVILLVRFVRDYQLLLRSEYLDLHERLEAARERLRDIEEQAR